MTLHIRAATDVDLPDIVAILNEAILNTTAVWSLEPTTLDARRAWMMERQAKGMPVLVADLGGCVRGFASYGEFRPWEGYKHSVEHSIYVDAGMRGRGIGRALLAALLEDAGRNGKHVMVAGIDAENTASIRLHAAFGFEEAGRLRQVGRKFGRWLDLLFLQKMLAA
ncbi:GNAT family N-acetyltransferase [Azospirillum picis]|uniref:Phosphinothricin acetyltransferase n=1 Tax=Azospirillum picis TaxID=488438 RepID=A0ABU0MPT0_9PROT|nr:GNAT family N-acetyltransferase [Azospirillum picis]MBP2301698.1 phosphinothricin acetyltransferase [Azospirillum picis]MDQ0535478.1 phosphinothricin acetyltransferase [Azospirillum picis]